MFNIVGYRMVFSYLEKKATKELDLQIDKNNFDETTLVEIKIPLNMPYFSDKEYEVAYGETEINGRLYQYVKRKVSNNTLYLLCLPNNEKTSIIASRNSLEKNSNDIDNNKLNKKSPLQHTKKLAQTDYIQNTFLYETIDLINMATSLAFLKNSTACNLCTVLTPEQPPEFCM